MIFSRFLGWLDKMVMSNILFILEPVRNIEMVKSPGTTIPTVELHFWIHPRLLPLKSSQMLAQKFMLKLIFVCNFRRNLILLANILFKVKMLTSLLRLIKRRSRRNNYKQTQFPQHTSRAIFL